MSSSEESSPSGESQSTPTDTLRRVQLYTDGACSGNPGPGGWAYVLRDIQSKKEREGSGAERETTNNRMELRAVIEGLKVLTRPCRVSLYADSQYVLNGLKQWMPNWKKNGWRRKDGSKWVEVKNADLWKELDQLKNIHQISFHHVKGHSGHPENERCDELAVAAYQNGNW
ncbi:ribonuclease HI [Pirellulaceae bacterium SH501]